MMRNFKFKAKVVYRLVMLITNLFRFNVIREIYIQLQDLELCKKCLDEAEKENSDNKKYFERLYFDIANEIGVSLSNPIFSKN